MIAWVWVFDIRARTDYTRFLVDQPSFPRLCEVPVHHEITPSLPTCHDTSSAVCCADTVGPKYALGPALRRALRADSATVRSAGGRRARVLCGAGWEDGRGW